MKEIYCKIKKRLQNLIKFGLALLALMQAIHRPVVMTIPRNNTDLSGRVSCSTLLMGESIKIFYIILFLFIITFLRLDGQICNAQQPILCNNGFTYTNGSDFESNLNTVFNSLVQDSFQTAAFDTSVYGQSPNQIYGLLNCRGDTTAEQCYNCSQEATTTIRQVCGNAGGGLLWFNDCFLHYGNYSFFGQLDTLNGFYLYNTYNVVDRPDVFNQALKILFNNLTETGAAGSQLYASNITTDSLGRNIYGLVQCWKDISSDDCRICLSSTMSYMFTAFPGSQGVRGMMGSCIVHYEMYPFFNLSVLPAPPAEAPSPNTVPDNLIEPSSNNTFIKCNHTVNYSSEYQSNLNIFLDSLAHEQWSLTGYNTYMSDQLYGFIRFRINATLEECNICIQKALNTIRQNCTTALGDFITLDVCSLGYESYNFLNLTAPPSATTEAPTEGNHTPSKEFTLPKKLGVVGGLLLALVVCLFATWRRQKTAIFGKGYEVQEQVEGDTPTSGDRQIVFKMEVLVAATENFHDDNKLGEGGFGPVYKGTIHGGKEIAVKKLSVNSMQGKREFPNEVKLVAKIQHRNLVKLLGIAQQDQKRCLFTSTYRTRLHGSSSLPQEWCEVEAGAG